MNNDGSSTFFNRRNVIFLLGIGLAEASMSMPMVQVPVYLRELGASITDIGFFFTISMIFPILVRIMGGWLGDAIGQLRVIFFGSLTGILTFAVYALAPSWQAALLGPALLAVTMALTIPAFNSYVAAHTQEGTRGRAFGLAQAIRNMAWVVAPPIGGFLGQAFGYRVMFAAASSISGLAAVIFLVLYRTGASAVRSDQPRPASLRGSLGQLAALVLAGGLVTWILLIDGLRDIGVKLSFDLMPVYLSDIGGISKQGIGLLDGIYGLALFATGYPAGWLVDKTSERFGLVLGFLMVALSRLLFPFSPGFWGFAGSWIILAVGDGLIEPAGVSLISRAVPAHLRGITFGLMITSLSIFSLPAPWLGSQAWARLGQQVPFLLSAVVIALMAIPVWLKLVPSRRAGESSTRPISPPPPQDKSTVTVLTAGLLPAGAQALSLPDANEQALLSDAARVLREHGGETTGEEGPLVSACFGLNPRRAPPQVSALLATHAGLALIDELRERNRARAADGKPLLALGVGIATGEADPMPEGHEAAWVQAVQRPLEEAARLQRLTKAAGTGVVLISEATYRYLASAHNQFNFGPSGPVDSQGGSDSPQAYLVLGRTGPLRMRR